MGTSWRAAASAASARASAMKVSWVVIGREFPASGPGEISIPVMLDRPAARLTEARITGYALTLAIGMWAPAIYFLFMPGNPFESGNGLGGDFRFFYVL